MLGILFGWIFKKVVEYTFIDYIIVFVETGLWWTIVLYLLFCLEDRKNGRRFRNIKK